ncbi:hypothetical protein CAAN1_17S01497 [[Candida] anglica]|uniref:Uncharacterized protein n=1 Tax=[Candida] anglica TaxID=148631 RepID=A0ABP0EBU1_9ASCO
MSWETLREPSQSTAALAERHESPQTIRALHHTRNSKGVYRQRHRPQRCTLFLQYE